MYLLDPKNLTGNHRQFLLSVILFELLLDLTLNLHLTLLVTLNLHFTLQLTEYLKLTLLLTLAYAPCLCTLFRPRGA